MTDQILLVDSTGKLSVNFTTGLHTSITRTISNPIIVINIPADPTSTETDGGAEAIDLKMLSDKISLSFKLTGGIGLHRRCDSSGYSAAQTTYTDYEKLIVLSKYDTEKKLLYWGNSTIPFYVVIENFVAPTQAGAKEFMEGCSLSLTVVNEDI